MVAKLWSIRLIQDLADNGMLAGMMDCIHTCPPIWQVRRFDHSLSSTRLLTGL